MSKRGIAHIVLFCVGAIYAVNYIVAKGIMPDFIGPSGFIFYRVFLATVIFWIIHRFTSKEKIDRDDVPKFIQAAIFGVALNQLMFFNGLNLTTPLNASFIMTSNPILVLIASAFILKERITPTRLTGIMLGLGGALLIILLPFLLGVSDVEWMAGDPLGDGMILINSMSYGIYLVTVKPLLMKYEPLTAIKWIFTFGCVLVFPFGYDQALAVDWSSFTPEIWRGFAFVIIFVSVLVYFFNVYAMKSVSPSVVSAYIYLQPVLAGGLSLALGMEELHWLKVVAALMIFGGVYLVAIRKKPTESEVG